MGSRDVWLDLKGVLLYVNSMEPNLKFILAWVTILVVAYVIIRLISERWNLPLLGDDASSRVIKGFAPDDSDKDA